MAIAKPSCAWDIHAIFDYVVRARLLNGGFMITARSVLNLWVFYASRECVSEITKFIIDRECAHELTESTGHAAIDIHQTNLLNVLVNWERPKIVNVLPKYSRNVVEKYKYQPRREYNEAKRQSMWDDKWYDKWSEYSG